MEKICSGEEITAFRILASGIEGSFGGDEGSAYRAYQATSAILDSFLGGASEGFTESLFKQITVMVVIIASRINKNVPYYSKANYGRNVFLFMCSYFNGKQR
ncbi:hypothetical protein P9074_00710 [Gallibacterium anatis]|uniref:hypothetical protein n=1 Tax=Gallibacterium anatis TaxID=750 RepID=UPI003004EE4D